MNSLQIIPILISVVSLAVSLFIAGWTVYKDVIRRPRFRVTVAVKNLFFHDNTVVGPDLYIEALNLGPIENRIGVVFAKPSYFQIRFNYAKGAFIASDVNHVGNTANAQRVKVGDAVNFVFPINKHSWNLIQFDRIGVSDGFGNMHWAPKKQFAEEKKRIQEILEEKGIEKSE